VLAAKLPAPESDDHTSEINYMLSQIESILSDTAYLYWDVSAVDDVYLLTVQIWWNDDDVISSGISQDELDKLDDSINRAFGDIGTVSDDITYGDDYTWTDGEGTYTWIDGEKVRVWDEVGVQ
jgi:hypothetical protein